MLKPITYEQVYDERGAFSHLRLRQGGQYIEVSLSPISSHPAGYKWNEIKPIIDDAQNRIKQEAITPSTNSSSIEALIHRQATKVLQS